MTNRMQTIDTIEYAMRQRDLERAARLRLLRQLLSSHAFRPSPTTLERLRQEALDLEAEIDNQEENTR